MKRLICVCVFAFALVVAPVASFAGETPGQTTAKAAEKAKKEEAKKAEDARKAAEKAAKQAAEAAKPKEPKGLHAKLQARKAVAESKTVVTGIDFQVDTSPTESFDKVLSWMKLAPLPVDYALTSKEKGIVASEIEQTKGGISQTGQRASVSLIASGGKTILRVTVSEYSRKKILAADNWSNPTFNEKETQLLVDKMKKDFAVTQTAY